MKLRTQATRRRRRTPPRLPDVPGPLPAARPVRARGRRAEAAPIVCARGDGAACRGHVAAACDVANAIELDVQALAVCPGDRRARSRAPKVLPASCAPLRSRRVAPGANPAVWPCQDRCRVPTASPNGSQTARRCARRSRVGWHRPGSWLRSSASPSCKARWPKRRWRALRSPWQRCPPDRRRRGVRARSEPSASTPRPCSCRAALATWNIASSTAPASPCFSASAAIASHGAAFDESSRAHCREVTSWQALSLAAPGTWQAR